MKYRMPVGITFGDGALEALKDSPALRDAQSVALFVGGSSLRKSGALDRIQALLGGRKIRLTHGIPENPGPKELRRETENMRVHPSDVIVAVGGGSVMDLAKSVALCVPQDEDVDAILKSVPKDPRPSIPLIAIPTTAGTGSEVTPFAVLWDMQLMTKTSLSHPLMFPREAIVDPELTASMPPAVTAATGMDAFVQASEAYWNTNANPISDDYALLAASRLRKWLPKAVKDGANKEARQEVMLGSLQAGLAFSNTRTAACHSISYPMTMHFGVVHGQAVGITLPAVLKLNASALPHREEAYCRALGVSNIEEAAALVTTLLLSSGLRTRLSELGIPEDGIETIVQGGFTPDRMGNNPYPFTAESMREMLLRLA